MVMQVITDNPKTSTNHLSQQEPVITILDDDYQSPGIQRILSTGWAIQFRKNLTRFRRNIREHFMIIAGLPHLPLALTDQASSLKKKETRTQQEVCNLFNAKYPDNPITQSTVSKIVSKFRETGVKDLPKSGQNPQSTSTLVASENKVSQTTVLRILRKENYHPYKFQLVQELDEDDPDRRLQFCETMMNLCQTNPNLYQQILFPMKPRFV
ncbi:hypothetical protein NQ318_007403 [Aromia moschata]|uniref:DUF4817 domain-containing protein n=1 Tax=Aromia moschata TaxID=1265417 RepID=A0AAV8YM29_9CUCU|nr:hypothetical protein NQ318_007403 [Aromia moschata]